MDKYSMAEHSMTEYFITPLTTLHAQQILGWRYPVPYDFYDAPDIGLDEEHYIQQFLDPVYAFHAVIDSQQTLCGFCSFGIDGQVPGGDYTESALDIGLGMHPDLTGQGHGTIFFSAILAFAQSQFGANRLRLTVARFNSRALTLYQKFGFRETAQFADPCHPIAYTVLKLDVTT